MDNFALEGGAPTYGCGGIEISSTGSIVVIWSRVLASRQLHLP
jgi:hypothetical protein